jgi:hypothetical protein
MRRTDPPSPAFGPRNEKMKGFAAEQGPTSGKIKSIEDIPTYKKLLITKLDALPGMTGPQALQSG